MKGSTDNPKIFISYSWSSPEHESWVAELGRRLMADGIEVVLDKWSLKEGQDKYAFMEKMISDQAITKVLLICDHKYKEKADSRNGGVGTETQIVSKKVYESVDQTKFIPVVRERFVDGDACLPIFLENRIYIDLSNDETYEDNYRKVVKCIYGTPVFEKPILGVKPEYVKSKETNLEFPVKRVDDLKTSILNDTKNKKAIIKDLLSSVLDNLDQIPVSMEEFESGDDWVVASIESLKPLRNQFIEFVTNYYKYDENPDINHFKSFFSDLITLQFPKKGTNEGLSQSVCKFFMYEIFLYFIAILLKYKRYEDIATLINTEYFFKDGSGQLRHLGPVIFNRYIEVLDETRNKRLNLRRVSITADIIKERATLEAFPFEKIQEIDLLLRYVTCLNDPENQRAYWYPRTAVYSSHLRSLDFFDMMISKEFFNNVKVLFGVNTKEEFIKKIQEYKEKSDTQTVGGYVDFNYDIPGLEELLKFDEIASV